MNHYSFMERKAMKKRDMPVYIKKKYGMEIESLLDWDIFYEKTEQILENAINRKYINELYEIGQGKNEETKEIEFLRDVISDIIEQTGKVDFFIPDIRVDCYMGLLCIDKDLDVIPEPEMEQGWGPTDEDSKKKFQKSDNLIRILNAQKHYPYAKHEDEDFPLSGIPGGCKEYHKLMMSQNNINIFATDINKENKNISFKKYGFLKAHDLYEELRSTPIENLLLLEKTLGIGYTNQLFYYVKDFTDRNQLDRLEEMVKSCAWLPMFVRKYITDKLWRYLKSFGYSDLSIQYAEEAGYLIANLVDEAYEAILEIYWYAHYWAYLNTDKSKNEENEELRNYWERYFDEEAAYDSIIRNENIHDWRGIKNVEDCFYCWKDKYGMEGLDLIDDKMVFVDIMVDDYTGWQLAVPGPRNELGEDILKMTGERLNEEICFHEEIMDKIRLNRELDKKIKGLSVCKWTGKAVICTSSTRETKKWSQPHSQRNNVPSYKGNQEENQEIQKLYEEIEKNNKEIYDLYYEIRCTKFKELKEKEQDIWEKDVKANAQKVKPLHVYALIHADIVCLLNE